jgi:hypothetical protein
MQTRQLFRVAATRVHQDANFQMAIPKEFKTASAVNSQFAQCRTNSRCAFPVFKTDEGRTFAGADASIFFVVFIVFFETAVRHPAVGCSLHFWGASEPRAKAHSKPSESENRDSGEEGEGETLARFSLSLLNLGSVSDQRAANGGVLAGIKQAKTNNHLQIF